MNTAGEQTLTVTYLDKTVEKTVKVCAVTSIRIEGVASSVPSGNPIDISNMKVWGVYNNKAETSIELTTGVTTNVEELNSDLNSTDARTLTVTYTGEYGTFSANWIIYAGTPELNNIAIDSYVQEVLLNEEYGKSNVSVYAFYKNGTSSRVYDFEMTAVATNEAGDVEFTVTYTEGGIEKQVSATVKVCTVTSIRVTGIPSSVQSGNDIDLSGIKVYGVYNTGTPHEVELPKESFTYNTIDKNSVGPQTLTVTYNGEFGEFTANTSITLTDPALTGITIEGFANEVLLNGSYNNSSVSVKATYGNGTSKTIYAEDLVIDIATNVAGNTTLTVTYTEGGIEESATATVKVCTVTYIVIKKVPIHLPVGEELDLTNMEIWGVYNSTEYNEIQLDKANITGNNVDVINANTDEDAQLTFKVYYSDDVFGDLEGTHAISAQEPILDRIEITNWDKEVLINSVYNKGSVVVTAYYGNGTYEEIGGFAVSDLTTSIAGDTTLTVTYEGKEATATVKICTVTSIRVTGVPGSVQSGNDIDLSGMKVYGVYNTGTPYEVELTEGITYNTIDKNSVGPQTLTVTYTGEFGTFTADASITLTAPALTGITIESFANEVPFKESYNNNSISVKATYGNGTSKTIYAENLTIEIATNVTGDATTLTVKYTEDGIEKTATATVKICRITSIRIDGVSKEAQAGKDIDLSAMKVYGVYNTSKPYEVELPIESITTNKDEIKDIIGNKRLKVTYTDEQGNEISENFPIYASAPELIDIEIEDFDATIGIGGAYDIDSIKVNAVYGNGLTKRASGFTVSAIDTSKVGKVTVTVTYVEDGATKSATFEIEVCAVANIAISGLDELDELVVDKGGVYSTSNIQLVVTFKDGSKRVVSKADGVIVADTLDTSSVGEKQLSVTYQGFSASLEYHVKDIAGIAILSGISDTLREGYAVDKENLIIEMTYSDGSKSQILASQLSGVTYSGDGVNETAFSVTYRGFTASKTLTNITLDRISALNSTMPATVIQNSDFSYANVKITAIYSNGDVYLVNDENVKFTPAVFDTSTPGTKGVEIEYFGKKTSVNILVQGVASVTVVDGSILKNIKVGQDLDVSGISVLVTYTDGTYNYANINSPFLQVGTIDTSTEGEKTLSVWYQGVKGETKINVINPSSSTQGIIFGALLPDELVARESYKKNFKDSNSPYFVGDDNLFYFYLNVILLDDNDNVVDVDGKNIRTAVKVFLVNANGSETELTGDALNQMVAFDATNNAYDFTEAAIGKTFRLEIRPADESSYVDEASVTKSHTVTIVDGYNIYQAWELNVITNSTRDITSGVFGDEGEITQVTVVDKFLKSKGITRPEKLASIVLHCNLDVKQSDLPPEYFYVDDKGVNQGMYDQLGVFHRNLSSSEKKFEIYGNYFSVYSYSLPCVTPNGVANNDDEYSASSLFRIRLSDDAHSYIRNKQTKEAFSEFVVNIRDIATRDNDPNSNDQSASERHMRGLCCYKVGETIVNMTNVNVDAYMTSIVVENMGSTVNLNKVKFYNAWQGHLFLWSKNEHQIDYGGTKQDTWSYIPNLKVNINDSFLAKCGGPVILAQAPEVDEPCEKTCGTEVVADTKSEIWTYVTGQEAWFVAVGQTQLAAQIRSMNPLIGEAIGAGHGFTSKGYIQGVETINMVMVAMGNRGTSLEGTTPNASFTRDGVVGLMSHYPTNTTTFQTPKLDEIVTETSGQAPIFQTNKGGLAFINVKSDGVTPYCQPYNAEFSAGTGDYITLHYVAMGAGIMMEYYHPAQ